MIGYRKLSIAVIYIITSVVLLVCGYVPGDSWMSAITTGMVAFFGSNLVERVTEVIKEKLS